MDFDSLTPEQRRELALQIGCTFDGCDTGDELWLTAEGIVGSPAEGKLSVLCETHTKMMSDPVLGGENFPVDKIKFVDITDLGTVSLN